MLLYTQKYSNMQFLHKKSESCNQINRNLKHNYNKSKKYIEKTMFLCSILGKIIYLNEKNEFKLTGCH